MISPNDLRVAAEACRRWPRGFNGDNYLSRLPPRTRTKQADSIDDVIAIIRKKPEYVQYG